MEMTELRFRVAERLLERGWNIFVLHEIGTDKAHHLFQKFWDVEAEWGFLRFSREPSGGGDVDAVVDWERSVAVAWGGYYARIRLLNQIKLILR